VYCSQTVWMHQRATCYGGRPRPRRHCIRWDPAPLPNKATETPSQFSAYLYCGLTAGCIKIPVGMEVSLNPGDFVLDGDPVPLPKKAAGLQFSANVYCGQKGGWIKMPLATEVGVSPNDLSLGDICVRWGPSSPPLMGHSPQFLANVRCGQTAGWTKMPLSTEVGLGTGDFVFDGDQALPEKGHSSPPNFWLISIVAKRLDG